MTTHQKTDEAQMARLRELAMLALRHGVAAGLPGCVIAANLIDDKNRLLIPAVVRAILSDLRAAAEMMPRGLGAFGAVLAPFEGMVQGGAVDVLYNRRHYGPGDADLAAALAEAADRAEAALDAAPPPRTAMGLPVVAVHTYGGGWVRAAVARVTPKTVKLQVTPEDGLGGQVVLLREPGYPEQHKGAVGTVASQLDAALRALGHEPPAARERR